MEPEEATFCSQAELPVEEGGHQHTHKTFDPKFVLHTSSVGTKIEGMVNE